MNSTNSTNNAQNAFFEAMCSGYAAGSSDGIKRVIELPGAELIRVVAGLYLVTDCWHTNDASGNSFGTTIISEGNNPIWMMHYWGQYEKFVTPFLKRALLAGYEVGFSSANKYSPPFMGCRGPRTFEIASDPLLYMNIPEEGSTFSRFSGQEQIVLTPDGSVQGWHKYHGFSLI